MRTFVVLLISVLAFPAQNLLAQPGWDAYKDARTLMNKFNLDPGNNQENLAEAAKEIAKAVDNISTVDDKKQSKVYLLAGEIYSTLATQDLIITQTIDPNHQSALPEAGMLAFSAYKSALGVTNKGYEVNEALDGIFNNINNMNAYASARYGESDFAQSYKGFSSVMDAVDLLEANQYGKPAFEDPATANELAFAAGLSAINAGMNAEAEAVFMRLKEKGYQNPSIYESLYRLYLEEDKEKAVGFLAEGRAQFPRDKGLLYAEINYALQNNELDGLVSKLEEAIAGDPENVSLYTTLGFVFDNLFQRELEAENVEQSEVYFEKALENYRRGLEVDDKNADAIYSIGALYYNKAAVMTQELVAMEEDFSKEGIRKYEAKQAEILQLFDEALPYFQRAESLKPDDSNILIALKEIYAKKGTPEDLEVSQEFSRRLEQIQSGENITTPYFKN